MTVDSPETVRLRTVWRTPPHDDNLAWAMIAAHSTRGAWRHPHGECTVTALAVIHAHAAPPSETGKGDGEGVPPTIAAVAATKQLAYDAASDLCQGKGRLWVADRALGRKGERLAPAGPAHRAP